MGKSQGNTWPPHRCGGRPLQRILPALVPKTADLVLLGNFAPRSRRRRSSAAITETLPSARSGRIKLGQVFSAQPGPCYDGGRRPAHYPPCPKLIPVQRNEPPLSSYAKDHAVNAILWITQAVCAVLFLKYGIRKLWTPKEILKHRIAWVAEAPSAFVVFIGCVEIAGAVGLIIPGATGILPELTPIAAAGLAVLMVFGAAHHARRQEYRELLTHETWFFASFVFIAWARFGPYPL